MASSTAARVFIPFYQPFVSGRGDGSAQQQNISDYCSNVDQFSSAGGHHPIQFVDYVDVVVMSD